MLTRNVEGNETMCGKCLDAAIIRARAHLRGIDFDLSCFVNASGAYVISLRKLVTSSPGP